MITRMLQPSRTGESESSDMALRDRLPMQRLVIRRGLTSYGGAGSKSTKAKTQRFAELSSQCRSHFSRGNSVSFCIPRSGVEKRWLGTETIVRWS